MKATIAARIFTALILILGISSCDKNRDTFLNRSYQNMVAHYNVYFNGEQKLEETRYSLEKSHVDDYSVVLDVFPYGSDDNRKSQSGSMDEVIKKASRVIAERPISKWVDDAYFMMGKAYFFKGDYFAAIETFQFLNSQFKGSKISYEATLWIIKSYVLLGKAGDAEAIIGLLNNDPNFPEKHKPRLQEVSAYVYIRVEKYKAASIALEKAMPLAKGAYTKARYHYILGQLYDKQGEREKARKHFKAVTKGTPPYEMAFNAKINLAKNYNPNNPSEVKSAKRYLKSMLRDDKNISYFAQIYYELGLIEKKEGDMDVAIENFRQSNQNNKGNGDQKALCFLELADIYFSRPDYKNAQLYYDSAVFFLKPEYKDYDKLKAKQEVLSELIKNLILIRKEDSLLKVAELPLKDIENLIDKAIKAEKQRREEEEKKKNESPQNISNPSIPNNPFNQAGNSGSGFYFEDPIQVARGFNDFTTKYGQRDNVDNWQFQALEASNAPPSNDDGDGEETEEPKEETDIPQIPKDSAGLVRQQYMQDIPFTPEAKNSSKERMAAAYLKVGEIYYEQLGELEESEKAFKAYITKYPKGDMLPKALYYLYKIYSDKKQNDDADKNKARLITEFPDSPYAKYLTQDPSQLESKEEGIDPKIIAAYQQAYNSYKANNYLGVIRDKRAFDKVYFGTPIQPKFDLLEALSYGRMDSVSRCIGLLKNLVANYPTSAEALEAQQIINAYEKAQNASGLEEVTDVPYAFNPGNKHYFIMILPAKKNISMNQVKARFSDFNATQMAGQSFAIEEMLVGERRLLIIKEFKDREEADKYKAIVKADPKFIRSLAAPGAEYLVGDPKNLGLMIVNSDLEGFLKFTSTYYIQK